MNIVFRRIRRGIACYAMTWHDILWHTTESFIRQQAVRQRAQFWHGRGQLEVLENMGKRPEQAVPDAFAFRPGGNS